jgi:hypothetical protein
MTYEEILKFGEIQYLKGRLDELYKGYVPNSIERDNRIVDSRITKYEEKLKKTDEISFHLYMTEKKNIFHSKNKNKREIKDLLTEVIDHVDDNKLFNKIKNQIEKY